MILNCDEVYLCCGTVADKAKMIEAVETMQKTIDIQQSIINELERELEELKNA